MENIIQQRDMYKSMASGPGAITTSPAHVKAGDAAKEARLTKELEEVKKDFAEYKVEKATNYKMLNDQVDKMREELTEARTKAAKLGSQEEYYGGGKLSSTKRVLLSCQWTTLRQRPWGS